MMRSILLSLIAILIQSALLAQPCENDTYYPLLPTTAPVNYDTALISLQSYPGDYAVIGVLLASETYTIMSFEEGDIITLRDPESNAVLSFGETPITFSPECDMDIEAHFNVADCGTESEPRHTQIIHVAPTYNSYVGINTNDPLSTLDVNGKITVADDESVPNVGMIRYNEETKDFEGYDGIIWRSFTQAQGAWGKLKTPTVISEQKIYASDGTSGDWFGSKVDIDTTQMAVVVKDKTVGDNIVQGVIDVYSRTGAQFEYEQTIINPNGTSFDRMGSGGVQLDGNQLIAGSPDAEYGNVNGRVQIFAKQNGTWNLTADLNSGNENGYSFGHKVTIEGNYAAVKKRSSIVNNPDKVLIYKKTNQVWSLHQTVIDPNNNGLYANKILLKAGRLFIGDPTYDNFGIQGRIIIFDIDGTGTFIQSQEIRNQNILSTSTDQFGYSIDADGDKLIIGSPGYPENNVPNCGRVFIYKYINGNYNYESIVHDENPIEDKEFGIDVKIEGDHAIVSNSIYDPNKEINVLKFNGSKWNSECTLTSDLTNENDGFGCDIAISNGVIVVGAQKTSVNGNYYQGAVHVFVK